MTPKLNAPIIKARIRFFKIDLCEEDMQKLHIARDQQPIIKPAHPTVHRGSLANMASPTLPLPCSYITVS